MAHRPSDTDSPTKREESTDGDAWGDIALRRQESEATLVADSETPKSESEPPALLQVPQLSLEKQEMAKAEVVDPDGASIGARHTGRYMQIVFASAIKLLHQPLSFILFLWLLAILLLPVHHTLRTVFAPLCHIPGVSRSAFCAPPSSSSTAKAPQWADYPHLMDSQSGALEQLLRASGGGSELAIEIKTSEKAAIELTTLVRMSNFRSRDLIADTLGEFAKDARSTGRELHRLATKVGHAVDGILAVNNYALHTIEGALAPPPRFALLSFIARAPTQELARKAFSEAMDHLATSLAQLTVEAQVSLRHLDALQERLVTLHDMLVREGAVLSDAESELLTALWTKLGGNRDLLRGHDESRELLGELGVHRSRALWQVLSALKTLQDMNDDMQDLRERVAAPEIVGSIIPVELHIQSIRSGLERLKEGRSKAREREDEARRMLSNR
ncbi:hypothetical protein HWV62_31245 [Athelia sp. TMB]|nr:hypothetical protein HWV62_31245 [Athelia sp. TMB]